MLVQPGFELVTSRSADRRSPNWANQGQQLSCAIGTRRSRAQDKWGISLLPLLRTTSTPILTALLLAKTRLQHPLQDISALWKCSIATILRESVDCQNSAGFNVNCSERNQASLQNTLLCPVHYHSFKKNSSNVRPTLFTFSSAITRSLIMFYPFFFYISLSCCNFRPFFQSDNKCILNRLTSKGPLLLASLSEDSGNEVDEHSVEAYYLNCITLLCALTRCSLVWSELYL